MEQSTELDMRNTALKYAISSGATDTISTAEKFLDFLKGPPVMGVSDKEDLHKLTGYVTLPITKDKEPGPVASVMYRTIVRYHAENDTGETFSVHKVTYRYGQPVECLWPALYGRSFDNLNDMQCYLRDNNLDGLCLPVLHYDEHFGARHAG